jgi:hypothetical protein
MRDAAISLTIAVILIIAAVACNSCTRVPASVVLPNVHNTDSDKTRTEYVHDTAYVDRWHKEYIKGDTVYKHDSIDRWRNRYVYIHDSIDNSRIDTIYQTVQVEKPYKQFLVNSGVALWIIIILIVLAIVAGLFIKFAK